MNPHTKLKSIVISKKLKKLLRRKFLTTNAQNAKCRIYFFLITYLSKDLLQTLHSYLHSNRSNIWITCYESKNLILIKNTITSLL